jgi:ABC-2 type transport system ATP-binding protein
MPPTIQVEHLVKKFKDITAVNDVSFEVEEGEIFGFLGPNGAGKTTTINILCTLLKPTSGRATLNGFNVTTQQNQVRQSIGLVFQDPSLDDYISALENLQFHAFIYHVPPRLRQNRIEESLKMVELWERRHSIVKTYSGGMKRRLELARGLLHQPKVLFLDEPTLGLDPQTRNRLWEYILKLRQERKMTIFMTTHYMDEAENADRIAIIDHGRIVALDTPATLKQQTGGDIIELKTANDELALAELKQRYQIEARHDVGGLSFEIANGDQFIPTLVTALSIKILSISLRRPTLDDVFLKLTGRQLRDQEAGAREILKDQMRPMRR